MPSRESGVAAGASESSRKATWRAAASLEIVAQALLHSTLPRTGDPAALLFDMTSFQSLRAKCLPKRDVGCEAIWGVTLMSFDPARLERSPINCDQTCN